MKSDFVPESHKWLRLPDHEVALYNCWDTFTTAKLISKFTNILTKNRQLDYYEKWFREMAPVVDRMQERGIGDLDVPARNAYRKQLRKELDEIEQPILDAAPFLKDLENEAHRWYEDTIREHPTWVKKAAKGRESRLKKAEKRRSGFFNRAGGEGSTDLSKLLFDHLGFKPAPKTQARPARATSQEALFFILQHLRKGDEHHKWVLENLFHRARLNTILTRYMTIDCEQDGRVRPLIKLAGTETLRLAYAGDAGEAIQQWPQEARHVIVASPGKVFLSRDYSQLEARLMAYYAHDTAMLEVFESGGDVHKQNAMDLGLVHGDWDALDPVLKAATRNFAKTFLYGLGYGGAAETMKTKTYCPCPRCVDKVPPTLELGRDAIKRASQRWEDKHQPIIAWRTKLVESIKGHGGDHTWTSPWGYRRFFMEPRREAERSIYNYPMQHGGSQIVNRAMVELDALGCPLVLQMHDELMAEVPAAEAPKWDALMKEVMEAPVKELGGAVFPTEGAMATNWGALK